MKNTINYYYNIIPITIHQKDEIYKIDTNYYQYILMPYYGNINNLNIIYNFLLSHNIYCHEIINNKENSIITIINNKNYILLKIHYNNKSIININNILSYNFQIQINQKYNWYRLWCQKLDYYEYQIREYGKKYPIIRESFSYYNGLCETAISLLSNIKIDNINMYINHQRISKNMTQLEFYNPLNLIIDTKVRDISDFIKIKFFKGDNSLEDIKKYIKMSNLNYNEVLLFYIRLIYPSYYFDTYDEIIQGKAKEDKLLNYINQSNKYEIFLKEVYILLNNYYKLPEIEWIKKVVKPN